MTESVKFDGPFTTWGDQGTSGEWSWESGWLAGPNGDFAISSSDPYWGRILGQAQQQYGDPGIHYNTGDTSNTADGGERFLVFSDGTRVPRDGSIVYHVPANAEAGTAAQNWIKNSDGTYQPATTNGDGNYQTTGPAFRPAGYQRFDKGAVAPINSAGVQIGAQGPNQLNTNDFHFNPATNTYTPLSPDGDYYEIQPDGKRIYRDRNGNVIPPSQYFSETRGELDMPKVVVPEGMTTPQYPQWATDVDPDIPNQMTGVLGRLYELFGSGTPARSELPEFPFNTDSGQGSGIDRYDAVREDFKRIEAEFDSAATAFKEAVDASANLTEKGRAAINDAIGTFNSTAQALDEGAWDGLLAAEATALESVTSAVKSAATTAQDLPANPSGGPAVPAQTAATSPLPGIDSAAPSLGAPPPADEKSGLEDLLNGAGSPFGAGMPMGGNPLGGLGGMNPLGGLGGGGNPMGGGGNPLSPLSEAVKPLSKLSDADPEKGDDKKSPITPLNAGPQNAPPAAAPGTTPAEPAAVAAAPGQAGATTPPAAAAPAGNAGVKPTVTLPDGKVIEAPNQQAADAAQNAIDKASPGGDAAQKAYSPTGLELPGDGKNLGAKVDPSDMQPGDVLKWQDKTMVAVAPGLVADPSEPGVVHTLEEVFKDQKGFEGVFRPTETDPTLSAHTSAPPLTDPQAPPQQPGEPPAAQPAPPTDGAPRDPQAPVPPPVPADPPPDSIPLSGPGPAAAPPPQQPASPPSSTVPQAAPPSPFEDAAPPPATRSTRAQRIAAGEQAP